MWLTLYDIGNKQARPLEKLIELMEQPCGRKTVQVEQPMQPREAPTTYAEPSVTQRAFGPGR